MEKLNADVQLGLQVLKNQIYLDNRTYWFSTLRRIGWFRGRGSEPEALESGLLIGFTEVVP
jgi:hypothetical protein